MEAAKGSGWNDGERSELRDRRETALRACDDQIRFFQGAARRAHWLYAGSQVVTIVISAAIPVVLLADTNRLPGWLMADMSAQTFAALLSALVAIATGLAGTFHWNDQWVRYAFFAQQLVSERARFSTGSGDYGKAQSEVAAIDAFVTRTEDLRMAEAGQWRERAMDRVNPGASSHQ